MFVSNTSWTNQDVVGTEAMQLLLMIVFMCARMIPLPARVAFMSSCSIFWNFYLSTAMNKWNRRFFRFVSTQLNFQPINFFGLTYFKFWTTCIIPAFAVIFLVLTWYGAFHHAQLLTYLEIYTEQFDMTLVGMYKPHSSCYVPANAKFMLGLSVIFIKWRRMWRR
jgi:hypothetical protein